MCIRDSTQDVGSAITEVKGGKIAFRVDKQAIIHSTVGRVSFGVDKLSENANELISTIVKLKPSSAKGTYIKSISVASTMSPGIWLDTKTFH